MCKLGVINQLRETQERGKAPMGDGPVRTPLRMLCALPTLPYPALQLCHACMPAHATTLSRSLSPGLGPRPASPPHELPPVPRSTTRAGDARDWAGRRGVRPLAAPAGRRPSGAAQRTPGALRLHCPPCSLCLQRRLSEDCLLWPGAYNGGLCFLPVLLAQHPAGLAVASATYAVQTNRPPVHLCPLQVLAHPWLSEVEGLIAQPNPQSASTPHPAEQPPAPSPGFEDRLQRAASDLACLGFSPGTPQDATAAAACAPPLLRCGATC